MMVGLLGILKAGASYVPLDPAYPIDRLVFMLADSRAPFLVTQQSLADRLPAGSAQIVCLDRDWPSIETELRTTPDTTAGPDHLAYVLYTSGSTGTPKGVQIPRRALAN